VGVFQPTRGAESVSHERHRELAARIGGRDQSEIESKHVDTASRKCDIVPCDIEPNFCFKSGTFCTTKIISYHDIEYKKDVDDHGGEDQCPDEQRAHEACRARGARISARDDGRGEHTDPSVVRFCVQVALLGVVAGAI